MVRIPHAARAASIPRGSAMRSRIARSARSARIRSAPPASASQLVRPSWTFASVIVGSTPPAS